MRVPRYALVIALVGCLLAPTAVAAEPTQAQRLAAQLESLQQRVKAAGEAYDRAYWRLDDTEARLAKVSARERATRTRLRQVRRRLAGRAQALYRTGGFDFLQVILGAKSFDEVVAGLDFFQRIGTQEASAIAEAERLSADLAKTRRELAAEQRTRAADVAAMRKQRDVLQADFDTVKDRYLDVRRQLLAAVAQESAGGGTASYQLPRGPMGMVFPVQGVHSYVDSWGAARSGGRHHQGTDIMAPRGTACVAILGGTITSKEGGLGGKTIWLRADNGWCFYYAHLDSWVVRSGRVRAGQLIGRVGDSGNAKGGATHLHFEIHPNGGAAVNPYPYLRAME